MKIIKLLLIWSVILYHTPNAFSQTLSNFNIELDKKIALELNTQYHFIGIEIFDNTSKKTVYERNSEKLFTPASLQKYITLFNGIESLNDSIASIKIQEIGDTIIFSGLGDPTFLHPEFGNHPAFEYLKTTSKKLFFNHKNISQNHFGNGWAWDDYTYSTSKEICDFPIYANSIIINNKKSSIQKFKLDSLVMLGNKIVRSEQSNTFQATEQKNHHIQEVPFKWSPELACSLLYDTLKKPVHISKLDSFPLSDSTSKIIHSQPKNRVLSIMMKHSDNYIAEQVMLQCAILNSYNSYPKYINDLSKSISKKLITPMRMVDASGLSRYNLNSPANFIKIISLLEKEIGQKELMDILAQGGQEGTLEDYYPNSQPYIFAKTGTLSNNFNIAGYLVTKSGTTLTFCLMNNHFIDSTSNYKKKVEEVLIWIRNNYPSSTVETHTF
ncbi:D-alanyl-D-alanine carboxypeptidase [Aureibacter tunicatorum]|uniref:D-alanyl-D-alanine carboxypeptidase n=1 Tax=Aureibacter tunicatorum TaxID=866807 RepID=UPI00286C74F4|nr:D-alanyl-D-alanine carboxypeptidase [Aureibacter tunicatorum]